MIAVVAVRGGTLPSGAEEAVNEASGRVLLVGDGTAGAARELEGATSEVVAWEAGPYRPAAWAGALAAHLGDEDVVLLPASADGRDLAPRLALVLDRPLYAPALEVTREGASVVRGGGLSVVEVAFAGPVVATLQPGARGTDGRRGGSPPAVRPLHPAPVASSDAVSTGVAVADPATLDLQEAHRIMTGGAGLGSAGAMGLLEVVAAALGCATGATRVVADAGWAPFERQIGTTGAVVAPDLYVAVGVSGAVQHVSGIGSPADVVAVNVDASCPMMAIADLALVTDGPALLAALARRLGVASPAADAARASTTAEADDPAGAVGAVGASGTGARRA